jgi:hypothetical protein
VLSSGDQFEQINAARFPDNFNASNSSNDLDNRSDKKGPEPEGVVVGTVDGTTCAFIGLERIDGVMVYDISTPTAHTFVQYINPRDFTVDPRMTWRAPAISGPRVSPSFPRTTRRTARRCSSSPTKSPAPQPFSRSTPCQ